MPPGLAEKLSKALHGAPYYDNSYRIGRFGQITSAEPSKFIKPLVVRVEDLVEFNERLEPLRQNSYMPSLIEQLLLEGILMAQGPLPGYYMFTPITLQGKLPEG